MSNVDVVLPAQAGPVGLVLAAIGMVLGIALLGAATFLHPRVRLTLGVLLLITGLAGVLVGALAISNTRADRGQALQQAVENQLRVTVADASQDALPRALTEVTPVNLTVADKPTDCTISPAWNTGDHYSLLVLCGDATLPHYTD